MREQKNVIAGLTPGIRRGSDALGTSRANAVQHRGPDDFGAWSNAQAGIALGHHRTGSRSGRFVMAFNGEIYNHMELRTELEGGYGLPRGSIGHRDPVA